MQLRQACCHPALVRSAAANAEAGRAPTGEELAAARTLPDARKKELLEHLAGPRAHAECAACGDIPDDAQAALCSHVFCRYALLRLSLHNGCMACASACSKGM